MAPKATTMRRGEAQYLQERIADRHPDSLLLRR